MSCWRERAKATCGRDLLSRALDDHLPTTLADERPKFSQLLLLELKSLALGLENLVLPL